MEELLTVKVQYGEDLRRFSLNIDDHTWENIEVNIKNFYPSIRNFDAKYQDDEGDKVMIKSQEELIEAIHYLKSLNQQQLILRLTIENKQRSLDCNPSQAQNQCHKTSVSKQHKNKFIQHYRAALDLIQHGKKDDLLKARSLLRTVTELNPPHALPVYHLARVEALLGNLEISLENLEKSVQLGYSNVENIETEPDLESLRNMEKYKNVINRIKHERSLQNDYREKLLNFKKSFLHQKIIYFIDLKTNKSIELARFLIEKYIYIDGFDPLPYYSLACIEALQGNQEEALTNLENSISLGLSQTTTNIEKEKNLRSLHGLEKFNKLIN